MNKRAGCVITLAVIERALNYVTFFRAGFMQFRLRVATARRDFDQLRQPSTVSTPQVDDLEALRGCSTAGLVTVNPGNVLCFAHERAHFSHAAEALGSRADLARRQAAWQHSACLGGVRLSDLPDFSFVECFQNIVILRCSCDYFSTAQKLSCPFRPIQSIYFRDRCEE